LRHTQKRSDVSDRTKIKLLYENAKTLYAV